MHVSKRNSQCGPDRFHECDSGSMLSMVVITRFAHTIMFGDNVSLEEQRE
jgi:hypothetical protein